MARKRTKSKTPPIGLSRCPTGIQGLDEITGGGLPRGRPALICGAAGCGKTLLAMEFLVRGATQFDEPGVFLFFEETEQELADNVVSLGFDLPTLVKRKRILLEHVRVERSEIEESSVRSRQAILCAGELKGRCRLEVSDIYQQPIRARNGQIVATPTLVKELPRPVRRLIGNLANSSRWFVGLGLDTPE